MVEDRRNNGAFLLHHLHYDGTLMGLRVYSVVLLLLGTKVWFLASISDGSKIPIIPGRDGMIHSWLLWVPGIRIV